MHDASYLHAYKSTSRLAKGPGTFPPCSLTNETILQGTETQEGARHKPSYSRSIEHLVLGLGVLARAVRGNGVLQRKISPNLFYCT